MRVKDQLARIEKAVSSRVENAEDLKAELLKERHRIERNIKELGFKQYDEATREAYKRDYEADLRRNDELLKRANAKIDFEADKQFIASYRTEKALDTFEREAIISDLTALIIEDVEKFEKHNDYTTIFNDLARSDNIKLYIAQIQHDNGYYTRNDYTELFYKAYNNVKRMYAQDIKQEREAMRYTQKRRRQRLVNNLFMTTSYLAVNKWANARAKRW